MSLIRIEKWCMLAAVGMLIASIWWGSLSVSLSLLAGAVISFASYAILRILISRTVGSGGVKRIVLLIMMFLKLIFVGIILWFMVSYVPINSISFLVGLSTLMIALLVETFYVNVVVNNG